MGPYPMFHIRMLGRPPIPTLRRNNLRRPACPPTRACTARLETRTSATEMAHGGNCQFRRIDLVGQTV
eukprot:1291367-Lingulodinium_polyedra.AAC.1